LSDSRDESKAYVLKMAKEHDVKFIRLWFTDILGVLKSFAITVEELENALENGMGFDGSSIEGFARIDESDMVAMPDPDTFKLLPWRPREHRAVGRMFCDILQPDGAHYAGDTRYVLKRALQKAADKGYKYYLGPVVNQLTSNQSGLHRYLLINALHEMGRLSSFSGETINLSLLIQLRSILLHTIPSEHELKITEVNSGYGVLFAVGATGKELLSQLPDEEIREILNKVDLAKVTGNNITDKKVLMSQLKEIRQKGYAISYGERIPGALCVSAGIKNYTHPTALSVLGPESRLKPRLKEIIQQLTASTRRISNSLMSNY